MARPSESLGFDFYRVMGRKAAVGCATVAAAQIVRGQVDQPVLHLTQPTGSVYRVGRRTYVATEQSSAIFVAPQWEFTRTSPPGTLLAIRIDQSALRDELDARCPSASGNWLLSLEVLAVSVAAKAALVTATSELVQATRPGSDANQLAHAEAGVCALLADLVIGKSAASPAGSLSHLRVIDLEEWIETHLSAPVTLGRLCQIAGVGARCLQKTFERRRGMSPMRYVTERRILAAFRRLSRPGPEASVTGIALELGFGHLGRFAHIYKQVIGESPSQTLATRLLQDAKNPFPQP